MKRAFDIFLCLVAGVLLIPVLAVLAIIVKLTSPGPVLYWSDRVGRGNVLFKMPKFRTMRVGTPAVATHLLKNADGVLTPCGGFLRRASLDELPQLYNILRGELSFVGPRPALFNQDDLVALRTEKGIHILTPGLTGWAQINGRDELPIPVKVSYDQYYFEHRSLVFDLKIIALTVLKVALAEGITH